MEGSSFFTTQVQYRALCQGARLAQVLGVACTGCDQGPNVLCLLQSYWNGRYFAANINSADRGIPRSGIDANTILGPIAIFDVQTGCQSPTLQPCHSRSLANFKALVDAFRGGSPYPINADVRPTRAWHWEGTLRTSTMVGTRGTWLPWPQPSSSTTQERGGRPRGTLMLMPPP